MKIALILPKGVFSSNNHNLERFWEQSPEMVTYRHLWSGFAPALLVIAALFPKDFDIELIDENFDDIDFDKSYDLVGVSAVTQRAKRAYQIADNFRKRGSKVIIGGIHPTVLPEEAKKHADTVFIGEAEETFKDFVPDFLNGNIKPFYRSLNPVDLLKSPLPRYDLLNPKNYKMVWIQTTRGCPINCEFCAASKIYGLKFRHKTVEQVINEVKMVKKIWGESHPIIGFSDDNMFMDRKYSYELLTSLKDLNIRWITQTSISIAEDEKLLRLLKESRCMMLFIGFESLSKQNLTSIDNHNYKLKYLNKYEDCVEKIQSCGIGVMGAFIVGFDSDNKSVFTKIVDFVLNNHLYGAQVTILTPIPGTRLRARLDKEGRLLDTDWDNYTFLDANYKPMGMTVDELQKGLLDIYKKIYNKRAHIEKVRYFKKLFSKLATDK